MPARFFAIPTFLETADSVRLGLRIANVETGQVIVVRELTVGRGEGAQRYRDLARQAWEDLVRQVGTAPPRPRRGERNP